MELTEEILQLRRIVGRLRTCEQIHKDELIAKLIVVADDLEQKNHVSELV